MKKSTLSALAILALAGSFNHTTSAEPSPMPVDKKIKDLYDRPRTTRKNDTTHRINKGSALKTKNRAKAKLARIARKRK